MGSGLLGLAGFRKKIKS
ncbi:MAG: hypothetical protein ACOX3E_14615 [Desulfomonilia bacterium]